MAANFNPFASTSIHLDQHQTNSFKLTTQIDLKLLFDQTNKLFKWVGIIYGYNRYINQPNILREQIIGNDNHFEIWAHNEFDLKSLHQCINQSSSQNNIKNKRKRIEKTKNKDKKKKKRKKNKHEIKYKETSHESLNESSYKETSSHESSNESSQNNIKQKKRKQKKRKKKTKKKKRAKNQEKNGEYIVEEIRNHFWDGKENSFFYEIKWKGYESDHNTYEPRKHLTNAKSKLYTYQKKKKIGKYAHPFSCS